MCGRFVDPDLRSMGLDTSWLKINPFANWTQRFNVKPTNDALIIAPDGSPKVARWWFVPHWHKGSVKEWKATTFNARIETAHEAPSFRTAWKTSRCIVPSYAQKLVPA